MCVQPEKGKLTELSFPATIGLGLHSRMTHVLLIFLAFYISSTYSLADIDLATLTYEHGVKIAGAYTSDESGFCVTSAGDINNDGIGDVAIGAGLADNTAAKLNAGIVYIVFGRSTVVNPIAFPDFSLASFTSGASTGVKIYGANSYLYAGYSVSGGGDVNGDSIDDLILSEHTQGTSGMAFVFFGHVKTFNWVTVDLSSFSTNSVNGFRIFGANAGDQTGWSCRIIPDINGDNISDIMVGAAMATAGTKATAGVVRIIYGRNAAVTPFSDFQLSTYTFTSSTGFTVLGANAGDRTGRVLSSAGDINHDGLNDLIIAAPYKNDGAYGAGNIYVLYGRTTANYINIVDLSSFDYTVGFKITGAKGDDLAGSSVSNGGDINNDGIDDIIIGASLFDYMARENSGAVYVVYGRKLPQTFTNINLTTWQTSATQGFRIFGSTAYSIHGTSVSSADMNGDGISDIILSAPGYSLPYTSVGRTYVVYGRNTPAEGNFVDYDLNSWNSARGLRITGAGSGDLSGWSVSGAGDVNGDGVEDVIIGAYKADVTATSQTDAGMTYIVYGTLYVPSARPTTVPTILPSPRPTSQPSSQPSRQPSSQPSRQPSQLPSSRPTRQPSGHPTSQPTRQPSVSPTTQPTSQPTTQPSARPSSQPSSQPSSAPSVQPTSQPTCRPSTQPSSKPTRQPSTQPSSHPSAQPSSQPTCRPSCQPTSRPSRQPTSVPSSQPSALPSAQPTLDPSTRSTGQPFCTPSTVPSSRPSSQPSRRPSSQPSSVPSRQPSAQPSSQPVGRPSSQPTSQPSSQPSAQPAGRPSAQPSAQPNARPSGQPTRQPSRQPTNQPSRQPSRQPTGQPSSRPSAHPTVVPPPTTEWVTTLDATVTVAGMTAVNGNVWACGSQNRSTSAQCSVVHAQGGAFVTKYTFPWDSVTSMLVISDSTNAVIGGRRTSSQTGVVTSTAANCLFGTDHITCAAMNFQGVKFVGGAYVPFTDQLMYISTYTGQPSVTILDSAISMAVAYTYTVSAMQSTTLYTVHSVSNFLGSFVGAVSVNSASVNFIVSGWVRADTGAMNLMYLTPITGNVVTKGNEGLITCMTVESTGPDSFVAGALRLTDTAGTNAYLVRSNALYKTVLYVARYRQNSPSTGASQNRRRLTTSSTTMQTIVRGVILVDSYVYLILDNTHFSSARNVTKLSVLKVRASSGAIVAQVHLSAPWPASLKCTDITSSSEDLLHINCNAHYSATNTQPLLFGVNYDLEFQALPRHFIRSDEALLFLEYVGMYATTLPVTMQSMYIETTTTSFNSTGVLPSEPTYTPTFSPIVSTMIPSSRPSGVPSAQPSSTPTVAPSVSARPTSQPSTASPTNTPKPSAVPVAKPSAKPSVTPSLRPSALPTMTPSAVPSVIPTARPTAQPSTRPTPVPSIQPSASPKPTTSKPSTRPTVAPSTAAPSVTPVPTADPSQTPTEVPTMHPTNNNQPAVTPVYVYGVAGAGGALLLALGAFLFVRYRRDHIEQKIQRERFAKVVPGFGDDVSVIPVVMGIQGMDSPLNEEHKHR